MRRLPLAPSPAARSLAAAVLLLLATVGAVRAADPVPPGAKTPRFTAKDVALTEATLPEGWKVAPAEPLPAGVAALREGVAAAAAESKEPDVVPLLVALATPEGESVVLALVESLRDPEAFAKAAQATAAKRGWSFRALGTPARVVLVAGPEAPRAVALAAQVAAATRHLAGRAADEWKAWRQGKGRAMAAYVLSQDVLDLDPKHAPSHLVKGDLILRMAANGNPEALPEDALAHARAAVAKDATSPLAGDDLVAAQTLLAEAVGLHGEALLGAEPPQDEKGRDALKEAVERLPGTKVRADVALRLRYNLACAHARLKAKDEAFAVLTAVLADLAKTPSPELDGLWRKDPDFAPLHDDPRWAALLAKHPPKPAEEPK